MLICVVFSAASVADVRLCAGCDRRPGDLPNYFNGRDTIVQRCDEPEDHKYVDVKCGPGGFEELGNQTQIAECSEPRAPNQFVNEWVAIPCLSGNASSDGTDTDIQNCTRPGNGKFASPSATSAGNCVTGDYQTSKKNPAIPSESCICPLVLCRVCRLTGNLGLFRYGMDARLENCQMPALWQYVIVPCDAGDVFVNQFSITILVAGSDSQVENCTNPQPGECNSFSAFRCVSTVLIAFIFSAFRSLTNAVATAGQYVTTPCVKFGANVHEVGSDVEVATCTAPGPTEYAALPVSFCPFCELISTISC